MTVKGIAQFFVEMELRLIASLKRNLGRHRNWEKAEGFDWPAWQTEKLRNIEKYRKTNKTIVKEYAPVIDAETKALMKEQFAEGQRRVDQEIEEFDLPKQPTGESFFGINEPRLDALIEDIQKSERTAESSTLRLMDDVYRKTILKSEVALSAGATTLPQAVDMAAKDFLEKGINGIEYKNGRRVNLATYIEMALRTASTRSYLRGEATRRAEYGIDTVLVSQYGACSETCLPWQGRVYIDDVWGDFKGETSSTMGKGQNGRWYPLLSVAVKAGLFHPNCRHTLATWYEGVSRMPKPLDSEKIRQTATLEARQRQMECEVRKWKRFAEGTQDLVTAEAYKVKVKAAQKALREFISEHSSELRRDPWRENTHDVANALGSAYNQIKPTRVEFGHVKTPPIGALNEILDIIGKDGKVNTRNIRDENGKLIKQINPNNHNYPERHPFGKHGEHAHDVLWENGRIVARKERELTEQERKEHESIL